MLSGFLIFALAIGLYLGRGFYVIFIKEDLRPPHWWELVPTAIIATIGLLKIFAN